MQSRTILVVDDEERIRMLLNDTLKAKGFEPKLARHGDDALQLFEKHEIVLMITDLMLPRMDGFQLIEEIRKRPRGKDLPIILMSAVYRDLKTQNRATAAGVKFLVKPFSLVEFLKMIYLMLELTEGGSPIAKEKTKPAASGPSPAAITGKIEHFAVPLLLVSFFSDQRTGVLEIKSGSRVQKIYLEKGVPVFAEGRIRKEDAETVRDVIRAAMGCSTGEYCFEPAEALPADLPSIRQDLYGIVYEVAHRYYRVDLLVPQFEKFQGFYVKRNDEFDARVGQVKFTADELKIIEQIDGQKTVSDLVTLGSSQIENVFQILWILQFMGAIRFQPVA